MGNGLARELQEVKPAAPVELPSRDVRASSVPLLGGLLRVETLRRAGRVVVLAALDVLGMFMAIWTALAIKTVVVSPEFLDRTYGQAKDVAPLACLVMLLLFARSGLYRERAQRPGFATVISSLFQVTVVIALYAVLEGFDFSSYYIFYGSLFFALVYVSSLRWLFERISGAVLHAAGYRRRAVLVGSGSHIDAVAHALKDSSQVDAFGYVSLTPRMSDGLRDFGSLATLERHFDAIDEVLIADPDFPPKQAVELVDRCHRHGIRVRVAPSTMEILMDRVQFVPGQSLPLFELKPPVFEGVDFVVKRAFDLIGASILLVLASPALALITLAIKLDSPGRVLYRSMRPGIGGR
ncbi:MAG: sugar transferase, partial [Actinomycetota bacterium]|nr:sugar transferase [Actinomycetota bacterium]